MIALIKDALGKHGSHELHESSAQKSRLGKPRQRTLRFRLACLVLACVMPVCLTAGYLVYYSYQDKRRAMENSERGDSASLVTGD